jgi:hypothetical protein
VESHGHNPYGVAGCQVLQRYPQTDQALLILRGGSLHQVLVGLFSIEH